MADANGRPRRVSMAFILGFSNKPFKDGGPPAPPPPRRPSAFKQMVTTPGGVIEWTASDGRRGKLTGAGKPRLTATSLAQVPSAKASIKAASKKDGAEEEIGGLFGGGGLFDEAEKDANATDCVWTPDQDKKLMELRSEHPTGPWADVANELGKKDYECKVRFKEIKPEGWQPRNAKGGGDKKQKQNKQKEVRGQKEGAKKEEEKKNEASGGGWDNPAATGAWDTAVNGWGATDTKGSSQNNGGGWDSTPAWSGQEETFGNKKGSPQNNGGGWDSTPAWSGQEETFGDKKGSPQNNRGGWDSTSAWPGQEDTFGDKKDNNNDNWASGGDSGDWAGIWDNNEKGNKADEGGWGPGGADSGGVGADTWGNATGGGPNTGNVDAWPSAPVFNDSSPNGIKPRSRKSASHAGSKQHSTRKPEMPSAIAPIEYELRPDSTFSTDDLRLVARILQQDCKMVWDRVSWRFRDKTGRDLHPDVFEKKITGGIEGKRSEGGRHY